MNHRRESEDRREKKSERRGAWSSRNKNINETFNI